MDATRKKQATVKIDVTPGFGYGLWLVNPLLSVNMRQPNETELLELLAYRPSAKLLDEARGLSRDVTELHMDASGAWTADCPEHDGRRVYRVVLRPGAGRKFSSTCTCSMGSSMECKHRIAILLALRERAFDSFATQKRKAEVIEELRAAMLKVGRREPGDVMERARPWADRSLPDFTESDRLTASNVSGWLSRHGVQWTTRYPVARLVAHYSMPLDWLPAVIQQRAMIPSSTGVVVLEPNVLKDWSPVEVEQFEFVVLRYLAWLREYAEQVGEEMREPWRDDREELRHVRRALDAMSETASNRWKTLFPQEDGRPAQVLFESQDKALFRTAPLGSELCPCPFSSVTFGLTENRMTALGWSCTGSCELSVRTGCRTYTQALHGFRHALNGDTVALRDYEAFLRQPQWLRNVTKLSARVKSGSGERNAGIELESLGWRFELERTGGLGVVSIDRHRRKKGGGWVVKQVTAVQLQEWLEGADDTPELAPYRAFALTGQVVKNISYMSAPNTIHGEAALQFLLMWNERLFPFMLGKDALSVRVRKGEFNLTLAPTEGASSVQLIPTVAGQNLAQVDSAYVYGNTGLAVLDAATSELFVARLTAQQRAALTALLDAPVQLPEDQLPQLLQEIPALQQVAPVRIDGQVEVQCENVSLSPVVLLSGNEIEPLVVEVRIPVGTPAFYELPGEGREFVHGGVESRVLLRRDLVQEKALAVSLAQELGMDADPEEGNWRRGFTSAGDAFEMLELIHARQIPAVWLREPVRIVRPSITGVELQVTKKRDWFGLNIEVKLNENAMPLAELLKAIRDQRNSVQLQDGTWMVLSDQLRRAFWSLAGVHSERMTNHLSPGHAHVLDTLQREGASIRVPPAWRTLPARIQESRTLDPELPAGIQAQLRPYQLEGYRWLRQMAHWSTGACLADDMGLGKTLQSIAFALSRMESGATLVVAPTSVIPNWAAEWKRFVPFVEVWTYPGRKDPIPTDILDSYGVVLVSYDLLTMYLDIFTEVKWHTLILDEAQAFKNPSTQRARAMSELQADFRLALTGTPVENRTGEIWSLFHVIAPGYLGSLDEFRERFVTPIERGGSVETRGMLAGLIRPFVLRRLKRDVATDLPERIETTHYVEFSPKERKVYERIRAATIRELAVRETQLTEAQRRIQVLAALTRLRQVACHARLVDAGFTEESSKILALIPLLEELASEGRKALVFSQFTSLLDLVEGPLTAAGLQWLRLDGSTAVARRKTLVEEFQQGDASVFLLSLKAGGTGLNLTAADTVVLLDPWWNPAVEAQAADRAHRIGQMRSVTIIRLVAQDTVENGILQMQSEKRELADALLDGTGTTAALGSDDLLRLMVDA
ncbi:MAG: DEAD/DEAH box helicase [Myxococcales bacterium]|nr:DEAD/DEAH box helicase [Myxococcales bacterium]